MGLKSVRDFVDDQNNLTMEVVMIKRKPYTAEYKKPAQTEITQSTVSRHDGAVKSRLIS
jgi:hypothetical protein